MRLTPRFLAVLVPVALVLAACGDDSDEGTDATEAPADDAVAAPEGLVSDGTLTVCSDTPYEPFEFKDDAGTDTGYDMDLLRAIADTRGPRDGRDRPALRRHPRVPRRR